MEGHSEVHIMSCVRVCEAGHGAPYGCTMQQSTLHAALVVSCLPTVLSSDNERLSFGCLVEHGRHGYRGLAAHVTHQH
jgi:hypothetical protein